MAGISGIDRVFSESREDVCVFRGRRRLAVRIRDDDVAEIAVTVSRSPYLICSQPVRSCGRRRRPAPGPVPHRGRDLPPPCSRCGSYWPECPPLQLHHLSNTLAGRRGIWVRGWRGGSVDEMARYRTPIRRLEVLPPQGLEPAPATLDKPSPSACVDTPRRAPASFTSRTSTSCVTRARSSLLTSGTVGSRNTSAGFLVLQVRIHFTAVSLTADLRLLEESTLERCRRRDRCSRVLNHVYAARCLDNRLSILRKTAN